MKILRLFGAVLLTAMMGSNFIACSDNDDEGGTPVSKSKKLVRLEQPTSYGGYTHDYTYDAQGHLIMAVCTQTYTGSSSSGNIETFHYTWTDQYILEETENGSTKYFLNNNGFVTLVQQQDPELRTLYAFSFTDNQISRIAHQYYYTSGYPNYTPQHSTSTWDITWEGDKLSEAWGNCNFSYSNHVCSGYYPLWGIFLFSDTIYIEDNISPLFYAHPELLGIRNGHIPAIFATRGGSKYTHTWNLDDESYMTNCSFTRDEYTIDNFTMVWR